MLNIVGMGLDPDVHCSERLLAIITSADEVVTFDPIGTMVEYLHGHGIEVEDIGYLYPNHFDRPRYYAAVASHLLGKLAQGKTVAYLTYGNPCVLDTPVALMVQWCKEKSIPFRIHENISFLDSVLSSHALFVGSGGLRMCNAQYLAVSSRQVEPDVLLIITQLIELGRLDAKYRLHVTPSCLATFSKLLYERCGNSPIILSQVETRSARRLEIHATVVTLPFFASAVGPLTTLVVPPRK